MKKLIIVFCGSLLFSHVWADQHIKAVAGTHQLVYQKQDAQIKKAILFYRREGSRLFMQQPMKQQAGQWVAELSGSQLQQPGVEYYIQFTLYDGAVKTDPAQYPEYNPMRMQVLPPSSLIIQMENTQIGDDQKQIVFKLTSTTDENIRVYINDVDVTDSLHHDGRQWTIKNEPGLFSGKALLKVSVDNGAMEATRQLYFADVTNKAESKSAANHELILRGNASLNLGAQSDSNNSSSMALTGNLHAETEYRNGEFESRFSGININYQRGADPAFNLSSGFLLSNNYKQHSLQLGDVSISGTPLVMSGFARRGLLYKTESKNSSTSLFNVRTSPVEGWESGISFDDRQTYGLSWQQKTGPGQKSSIQLALVSGQLKQPQSSSVGSSQKQPQSGDTAGIQFDTELGGFSVSAQLASSKFDGDTTDSIAAQKDDAYELKLRRNIYGLASSIGFHRYGANYATIANPNFSNDRQGLDISLGSQLQMLGWTASFSTTRDNIRDDASRPVVLSDNSGLNINMQIPQWPSINMGFNLSQQRSRNEPSADQRVKNKGQDISLGISDRFDAFTLNWSSSIGRLRDDLDATKDSDTRNHSLSLGYQGDASRVNLNLSQNRNITQLEQISDLVNLSADVPLMIGSLVLNSQFSYQHNTASDNSQDNTVLGGSARVSWTLKDMWRSAPATWGKGRFSLNWTFNQTSDALNPANDVDDTRLLLEFSMGAPVNFENKWTFE